MAHGTPTYTIDDVKDFLVASASTLAVAAGGAALIRDETGTVENRVADASAKHTVGLGDVADSAPAIARAIRKFEQTGRVNAAFQRAIDAIVAAWADEAELVADAAAEVVEAVAAAAAIEPAGADAPARCSAPRCTGEVVAVGHTHGRRLGLCTAHVVKFSKLHNL